MDHRTTIHPTSAKEVPELLTAKELEGLLKIDLKTIYSYAERGLIPYVKIQSNIRFRKTEIHEWIENQTYRPRPVNGTKGRVQ